MLENKLGIYIHWPWCGSKCEYCDFNSYVENNCDEENYIKSLIEELDYVYKDLKDELKQSKIESIYFGGGTPTLMSPDLTLKIITEISKKFEFCENIEISMECNPASVDEIKLREFKKSGINRLSIGVQSFDDVILKFLGRKHTSNQALATLGLAKSIFNNVSIDLIYGIPEQSLDSWKSDLKKLIELGVNHVSCYQLTIEMGTGFYKKYINKDFTMPTLELQRGFFDQTREYLEKEGFDNYEVSNFAKKGFKCNHNLNIWNYNSYIGLGAGAHSRIINKKGYMVARKNELNPKLYQKLINLKESTSKDEILTNKDIAIEMIMLGLRLKEGLDIKKFEDNTNIIFENFVNQSVLNLLLKKEMLKLESNRLRLTNKSYHLLDEIIANLIY